jgi:hypothetical protein
MWGGCYVLMLKRVPYQNMLELRSGERVIFSIMSMVGCARKDHMIAIERDVRRDLIH